MVYARARKSVSPVVETGQLRTARSAGRCEESAPGAKEPAWILLSQRGASEVPVDDQHVEMGLAEIRGKRGASALCDTEKRTPCDRLRRAGWI